MEKSLTPTNGADHYYDDSIDPPPWAKNIKSKLVIEKFKVFMLNKGKISI